MGCWRWVTGGLDKKYASAVLAISIIYTATANLDPAASLLGGPSFYCLFEELHYSAPYDGHVINLCQKSTLYILHTAIGSR